MQYRRRLQVENQAVRNETIQLATEKFKLEQLALRDRAESETPVCLLQLEKQRAILDREIEVLQIQNQARALEVERDLLELSSTKPAPGNSAAGTDAFAGRITLKVFQGANLSIYGSENQALSALLPLFDALSKTLRQQMPENGASKNTGAGAA